MMPLPHYRADGIDFAGIRASVSLSSLIGQTVKLTAVGSEWKGLCCFHPDRTPSLTVNDDKGFYHCFGCGAHGDAIDFLVETCRVGPREAAAILGHGEYSSAQHITQRMGTTKVGGGDRSAEALEIWSGSQAISGTAGESYLRRRGITIDLPEKELRFSRVPLGRRPKMPALVALIRSAVGTPIAIQRTFLNEKGGKADLPDRKVKFNLGRSPGASIQLAPAGPALIVTEGVEDGLSLLQMTVLPVWVATGAGKLARLDLPDIVQRVIIGADSDASGREQAQKAAHAFAAQGRDVRIIYPTPPHKDFNEELMEASNGR